MPGDLVPWLSNSRFYWPTVNSGLVPIASALGSAKVSRVDLVRLRFLTEIEAVLLSFRLILFSMTRSWSS